MERGPNLRRLGLLAGMVGSLSLSYWLFEKGLDNPSSRAVPAAEVKFNAVATFQGPKEEDEYCIVQSGHTPTNRIFQWCYDFAYHLPSSTPVPANVINRYGTGSESVTNPYHGDAFLASALSGDVVSQNVSSAGVNISPIPASQMHEALWAHVPTN